MATPIEGNDGTFVGWMKNYGNIDNDTVVCSNLKSDEVGTCYETCVGLAECSSMECPCAIYPSEGSSQYGGPWGDFMDVLLCLLPILFLVYATLKAKPIPTTVSLPIAAIMLWWIRLAYLRLDVIQTCSAVVLGLHEALTPITIMAGAITLFETMEATLCLPYMMRELKSLTAGHPVAELMLIFCFATLIEGASGFGTPVALAAPMLVSTGNPPFESVVTLLLFNAFVTCWGAVGTPIWFGFGNLNLTEQDYTEISTKAGVALGISAFILIPLVLTIIVPFHLVKRNIVFILLSLCTCIGCIMGIASVDYQFPTLIGGLVGCIGTAILINFKIGLVPMDHTEYEIAFGHNPDDIGSIGQNSNTIVKNYNDKIASINSLASATDIVKTKTEENNDNIALVGGPDSVNVNDDEHAPGDRSNINKQNNKNDDDDVKEKVDDIAKGNRSNDANNVANNVEDNVDDVNDLERNFDENDENDNDNNESGIEFSYVNNGNDDDIIHNSLVSLKETIDDVLGPRKSYADGYVQELLLRTFPLWATVVLLVVTRIKGIGLRKYLQLQSPYFQINFGTYGTFRLSVSLVFQLLDILTYPNINWRYELLFVPFFIPFILISLVTMFIFRNDMKGKVKPTDVAKIVLGRLGKPFIALLGALSLVQLMIRVGTSAPAFLLGDILAGWFQRWFIVICPLLGALGSFFSGSTTVSNLTFGDIQYLAANNIGTSYTAMLALQCVGASAGNGICLNNIISACAVVGLTVGEGTVLAKTAKIVFSFTTIATIIMVAFFFRFN